MDAHSAIHVPLSTTTTKVWSQDWVADLDFFLFFSLSLFFFFLNRGPCLCLAVFCGEHGFFKGGGSEMKEGVNEW